MTKRVVLLDNGSETGAAMRWPGGPGVFSAVGSFNGATVKLQHLGPDGATWLDISGGACDFQSNGQGGFVLPQGSIRAAVTGGSPSAIHANAVGI